MKFNKIALTLALISCSNVFALDVSTGEITFDNIDQNKFEDAKTQLENKQTDFNQLQEDLKNQEANFKNNNINLNELQSLDLESKKALESEANANEYAKQLGNEEKKIVSESSGGSDDECAIWMCLPKGFITSSCNAPHRAMHKRIARHKSPLPSLSGCMRNNVNVNVTNNKLSYQLGANEGVAAYIPANRYCVKTECLRYGFGQYGNHCAESKCVKYNEATYVKGTSCIHYGDGYTSPKGCVATYNYVEVLTNGQIYGEPYYFQY